MVSLVPGTVSLSLSLAPAIRVRLAPRMSGPEMVCLVGNNMNREPGTRDAKPGTRDGAVFVCTRSLPLVYREHRGIGSLMSTIWQMT